MMSTHALGFLKSFWENVFLEIAPITLDSRQCFHLDFPFSRKYFHWKLLTTRTMDLINSCSYNIFWLQLFKFILKIKTLKQTECNYCQLTVFTGNSFRNQDRNLKQDSTHFHFIYWDVGVNPTDWYISKPEEIKPNLLHGLITLKSKQIIMILIIRQTGITRMNCDQ